VYQKGSCGTAFLEIPSLCVAQLALETNAAFVGKRIGKGPTHVSSIPGSLPCVTHVDMAIHLASYNRLGSSHHDHHATDDKIIA